MKTNSKALFRVYYYPFHNPKIGILSTLPIFLFLVVFGNLKPNESLTEKVVHNFSAVPPDLDASTCNNLLNHEFDNGTIDWYLSTQAGNAATFSIDASSQLSGANSAFVDISTVSGTDWHIQLSQSGHAILNGTTYYIRFKARATAARTITLRIQEAQSPYSTYYAQDVNITSLNEEYGIFSFTPTVDDPNVVLKFEMGHSDENVYLDDIVFGEMDCYFSEYTNTSATVTSTNDDAEEDDLGVVSLLNTSLTHSTTSLVGTRFNGVAVPQGASIIDAFIEYTVDATSSSTTNMILRAQDSDNAAAFSSTVNDISSRTSTASSILWNSVENWNPVDQKRFSVDISTIIQEVVDRPGWVSGNAIAIIAETSLGGRTAAAYDQLVGTEPVLHIGFTTGEVCNNGIDDDGDGLIDCGDCADCASISVCNDLDGDEVANACDLDDDNDGIPDSDENRCDNTPLLAGGWLHNSVPMEAGTNFLATEISSVSDMVIGSGISAYEASTALVIPGIDQTDLTGAIADNDYLEYSFTTNSGINALHLNQMETVKSSAATVDNYGYDISIRISEDNFTSYSQLTSRYTVTPTVPGSFTFLSIGTDDNFFYLKPATTYTFRVYFFNKTTSLAVDAWWDDFAFFTIPCDELLDTDGDGVYNHLDVDSDNDGLFDLNEAGHAESDVNNDGRIDGNPSTFGANGLFNGLETAAENGILNYSIADSETSPDGSYDAYELDADGDGCYDVVEEGMLDSDNNGLTGTGTPTIYSDGRTDDNTYFTPSTYVNWQNPLVAFCIPEICNNNIDDDGDGLIDCDDSECTLCNASCGDNDNDGIGDICDLDDDNDGILDDVEALKLNSYGDSAECTIPFIDFTNPVLESGVDNEKGAVYRYSNVSPGLDALVSIDSLTNATLNDIDMEGGIGFDDAFQPSLNALGVGLAIAEINFQFVDAGTSTPSPAIERIGGTFYDIDGGVGNTLESIKIGYPGIIGWDNPTLLDISTPADGWEITSQGSYEGPDIDSDPRLRVYFMYRDTNQITIKFQQYRASSSGSRSFSMRFNECDITDFENIQLVVLNGFDNDNDGVDNHIDLDSDNDGIFDLNEAGHAAPDTDINGIIDGLPSAFGNNGVYDGIETYPDSDSINYILADSETVRDTIYDFFELDSDGDGCFDVEEAGVIDGDSDGIAGSGVPAVDSNGLVTAIIYAAPIDTFWINPIIAVCNPENCNDGIDNDGDGFIDSYDTECCSAKAPTLSKN